MKLWIEEISRAGQTVFRVKENVPTRIGRSYACDFVVDDDAADLTHLIVDADEQGNLVAVATGQNHFWIDDDKIPVRQAEIDGKRVLRIGQVRLGLCPETEVAGLPRPDRGSFAVTRRAKATGIMLALLPLLATFALNALDKYLFQRDGAFFNEVLASTFWLGTFVVTWFGVWSLIGYAVNREVRLRRHLVTVGSVFLVGGLIDVVLILLASSSGMDMKAQVMPFVIPFLIGSAVWIQMRITFDKLSHKPLVMASLMALVLVGSGVCGAMEYLRHVDSKPDLAPLAPSFLRLVPAIPRDQVMQQFQRMESTVDATRLESIPERLR